MKLKKLFMITVAAFTAATVMAQSKISVPEEVTVTPGDTALIEVTLSDANVTGFDLRSNCTIVAGPKDEYAEMDATDALSVKAATVSNFSSSCNKGDVMFFSFDLSAVMSTGVVATIKVPTPKDFLDGTLNIKVYTTDENNYQSEENVSVKIKAATSTGIDNVVTGSSIEGGYTLMGTKAQKGQKGIRIVNGKKVIVK